jgi:hypothetical protein
MFTRTGSSSCCPSVGSLPVSWSRSPCPFPVAQAADVVVEAEAQLPRRLRKTNRSGDARAFETVRRQETSSHERTDEPQLRFSIWLISD